MSFKRILLERKTLLSIIFIILFSGILVIDLLLHKGTFTSHDIETHLVNFSAFYSSIKEGNIIPRWAGNIANLYGGPSLIFYYPMSYYLALVFPLLGFSLVNSMKIYIFLSFIFSSLFMYVWLRKHVSNIAASIGAFLYVYAPYRITDIYARGSIAENTAFMFLPLVALLIYLLVQKPSVKKVILLSLGISVLILSHPFMLLIFTPFYILYALYLNLDLKKIIFLITSGLLSLLTTAYYLIPLLIENKYTHYDASSFSGTEYTSQFLSVKKMVLPVWTFIDATGKLEYQSYQIGLLQIALFIISTIFAFYFIKLKKINNKVKMFFLLGLVNFLVSIFLMLSLSDVLYKIVPPLQRIQFPWRFLSLNLFSLVILTVAVLNSVSKKIQLLVSVVIVFTGLVLYLPYAKGHDYIDYGDTHYLYNNRINLDAFVSLPLWAAQPDKYPRVFNRYEIIRGDATLTPLVRMNTKHVYGIDAKTEVRIADSTFYFPGWNVYLDGKPTEIEFQDPSSRGIITFIVPKGQHLLEVVFTQTKVRRLADTISLLTIIFIVFLYINAEKVQNRLHRYIGM